MRTAVLVCGLLGGSLLAACAPKSLVVLATTPDHPVGGITVSNAAGAVQIDTPNQKTTVADADKAPSAPAPMADREMRKVFGRALAAQPQAAVHFVLYFDSDSTDLRPESAAELPAILDAVRQRGPGVVTVIGHSDTFGDKDYNYSLSLRRAEAVKARLVAMGVAEASLEVSSHGESNPVVRTGDNVKEDRNRRVEVIVR